MADPRPPRVRFGPFVWDTTSGEFWKAGRPIKLQDQPRQLLAALLERPGEVLSRDELRRRLWPDDTFVDFDNALNVGIRKVREALGDVAPTARFVETVRGQGYRFIAPVSPEGPVIAGTGRAELASERTAPLTVARSAWPRAAMVVMIVGAAFGTAYSFVRSPWTEPRIDTIAVLPFDNLLPDEAQQYQVDGLTDAVTRQLSAQLDTRVVAGQSAAAARDLDAPQAEIARRLGADALLVGSVATAGAGVVINARVVERSSGRVLWSGRFERSLNEPSLADDIVAAVAGGIGRRTSVPASAPVRSVSLEARDAYLRGRFFWAKRGQANSVTAVNYLSAAIQLQPDYAQAWSGLADVYAVYEGAPSPVIVPWPGDSVEAGMRAAREALRLAPELGEAHAALGKLYVARRRWAEAERSFAEAVALSPQYSTARQWYGTMLSRLRRCDEALEQVQIAARLDPLTALVNESVGSVYLVCGEPRRAIEVFDAVLAMHPTAHTTRHRRARALTVLGRYDDAIREFEALAVAVPGDAVAGPLAVAHAQAGDTARARALLASVTAPYVRAHVLAALGEADAMFQMLEQALAGQPGSLQNLVSEPEFERYRYDPRFVDFARRAGFPIPIRDARFSPGGRDSNRQ